MKLEEEYDVHYLLSDFKKKNGYQRSVELSHEYGMYRQDYCGCVFSMRERNDVRKNRQRDKNYKSNKKERGKEHGTVMGRTFYKKTDRLVYNFNASITFDQKF